MSVRDVLMASLITLAKCCLNNLLSETVNKAYRPNAHLLYIVMHYM